MKNCPPVRIRKFHRKTAGQEKFDRVMLAPLDCTHQRGGGAGVCRRVQLCSLTEKSLVAVINGEIKDLVIVIFRDIFYLFKKVANDWYMSSK